MKHGSGNVQPGFIYAERLHQIGILPVDLIDLFRIFCIQMMMRRNQCELRTFLLCLPNGFGCLDAIALRKFVFRKDNSVAVFRIAADRHRHAFELRPADALNRSKIGITITMQYGAIHGTTSQKNGGGWRSGLLPPGNEKARQAAIAYNNYTKHMFGMQRLHD
ncbi:hypothetical protein SDC9_129566 [bioreactor metagenome]|uniref:Uncharacterized protein n=1 Tax=bioreactor metagenome TaxID=1076179 RepID=A0A645D054_9ZZZZ